jgi:transcriptional regulator with XRE-family HTH domain
MLFLYKILKKQYYPIVSNNYLVIFYNQEVIMVNMTYFAQKCAEMRKKLGINQTEIAKIMGFSQEYLSKLENGQKPLTIPLLKKYLAAFQEIGKKIPNQWEENMGIFPLDDQLEFFRELFDYSDKIEINLSDISIIHRQSLTRLMAILVMDDYYPMDNFKKRRFSWLRVNNAVKALEEDPEQYQPNALDLEPLPEQYYKNKKKK